jgi:hypothetical protein
MRRINGGVVMIRSVFDSAFRAVECECDLKRHWRFRWLPLRPHSWNRMKRRVKRFLIEISKELLRDNSLVGRSVPVGWLGAFGFCTPS